LLQKHFKQLEGVSLDAFYKALNIVKPSFIRIEADEVTYGMHVILRFELEKALIEGSLNVRDIPEAWNAKMQELLGITPSTNSEGCLQDIHWSMGSFGYFPTYTLGNLYAAHLFTGFEKDHPDWQKVIATGELGFIKSWLNKSVHQYGRQYTSKELLKKATGKAFSADAYVNYITKKYTDLHK
jgi:carboxypeptidase Taq